MKKFFYIVGLLLATIATTFASCNSKEGVELTNEIDTLSYAQGMILGNNLNPQLASDPKINKDEFLKGFKEGLFADSTEYSYRAGQGYGYNIAMNMERDVYILGIMLDKEILYNALVSAVNGDSLLFSDIDATEITNSIFEKLLEKKRKQEEARLAEAPEAKANLAKGNEWLANKEKEEGVIKTKSGLLYKVIENGNGERPNNNSVITMNYKGSLIDGTVFDEGNGAKLAVNNLIPGFTEALLLMDKGSKYEIYIPANLGYGAFTQGGIPANSTLIFEVELTNID